MLRDADVTATIGVRNLEVASRFYQQVLGLEPISESEKGVQSFKCGSTRLLVYTSRFAGTGQATAATWVVKDIEAVVRELKARGVTFEHYDMPGIRREGDLHTTGTLRNAWLKDPDGNILSIVG